MTRRQIEAIRSLADQIVALEDADRGKEAAKIELAFVEQASSEAQMFLRSALWARR